VFKIPLGSFSVFSLIIITFLSSGRGLGPDHRDAHVLVRLPLASNDLGLGLVPDLPGDVTLALEAGPSLRKGEGKTEDCGGEGGGRVACEWSYKLCLCPY